MWMMLQRNEPDDYVLATGETHSVRTLVELAYGHPAVGARIRWDGEGADEVGRDAEGRTVVAIDPVHYRPTEVNVLRGDAAKAREVLGWAPTIDLAGVVDDMVTAALASIET
jgi:GDPmannose 4,6-dehydratase